MLRARFGPMRTWHSAPRTSKGCLMYLLGFRSNYAAAFAVLLAAIGIESGVPLRKVSVEASGVQAPLFEVEPLWPKPLPNHWVLGRTVGVSVDGADHIWIIHRAGSLEAVEQHAATNPPAAQCCVPAPPVLEFDEAG